MPSTEIDPNRCPLCGSANECGMAKGADTCWCFTATITAEALELIPEAARGIVCVCRLCGSRSAAPIK